MNCEFVLNVCYIDYQLAAIAVASYGGLLRVYCPQPPPNGRDQSVLFQPEDLICETKLKYPILQIESGLFSTYVFPS